MDTPKCSKPSCPIATGGRCLEGFAAPRSECPNLVSASDADRATQSDVDLVPASEEAVQGEGYVAISSGSDLSEYEAAALCRQTHCRVVVIAGVEESGKSALVTCPFHRFLEGSFGTYTFAGSRTLSGFDERCHRARVDSGRTAATIGRTSGNRGGRFLHLRVSTAAPGGGRSTLESSGCVDLLVTDIAGEAFRHARDNVAEARNLSVLRRADRLAILLDGALIRDGHARQGAARDSLALFRSLLDAQMIGSSTAVDFVVTKWDLLADSENDELREFLRDIERKAMRQSSRVAELLWHRTAALPTRQSVPLGFGIDVLFGHWVGATHQVLAREVLNPPLIESPTELARLGYRYIANARDD